MTPQELAELDLAVAKAEGLNCVIHHQYGCCMREGGTVMDDKFQPTRDWSIAGALLEKYRIELNRSDSGWVACPAGDYCYTGETLCIAICKAVIALKS